MGVQWKLAPQSGPESRRGAGMLNGGTQHVNPLQNKFIQLQAIHSSSLTCNSQFPLSCRAQVAHMPVTRPLVQETPIHPWPQGVGSEGSQLASTASPLVKEACGRPDSR